MISIDENWLNKKNHTEHKHSVFLESRNNKTDINNGGPITFLIKQHEDNWTLFF